jgi:hypothetical protein
LEECSDGQRAGLSTEADFGARDSHSAARREQCLRDRLVLAVLWLDSWWARASRFPLVRSQPGSTSEWAPDWLQCASGV